MEDLKRMYSTCLTGMVFKGEDDIKSDISVGPDQHTSRKVLIERKDYINAM